MTFIRKSWNSLFEIIIPYTFVGIFIFLWLFYAYFPDLFFASIPELIGTFVGAVLGFELGMASERRFRSIDEENRAQATVDLKEKNRIMVSKILTEEIKQNKEVLASYQKITYGTKPEEYFRTSSWKAVTQQYLDILELDLMEKLYDLYFDLEIMNTFIDYIYRRMLLGVPDLTESDSYLRYLYHRIRTKPVEIITSCDEIITILCPKMDP